LAIERQLVVLPVEVSASDQQVFARTFQEHAVRLDSDWPFISSEPAEGAMDDALNSAYPEAVRELQANGRMLDIDADDCDFGSVAEEWDRAGRDAKALVQRPPLVKLMAPTDGAKQLSNRDYRGGTIVEFAEDLSAWTKRWALPRGQLNPEQAASALLLWLSPQTCGDVDAVVHALAADPFVSRATRYIALRLGAETVEA
jgi:hypothetical protein